MKIKGNKQKKWAAGRVAAPLLAFALTAAAVTLAPVLDGEARAVDFDKACSLDIEPGSPDLAEDLAKAGIKIDLYKVAKAVPVPGHDTYTYGLEDAYTGLMIPEQPTNEDWKGLSQQAAAIALEGQAPTRDGLAVDEKVEGLESGLYLVIARGAGMPEDGYVARTEDENGSEIITTLAQSDEYSYSFLPELVSLPGKEADEEGNASTADPGEWLYDMEITLKPRRDVRYGALEIVKQLTSYETKDPATFVFQVEAFLGEGEGERIVFSDVVSISFTAPGQKKEVIHKLPVGARVKVTEVYSGAVYTPVTAPEQTTVIEANQVVQTAFTNDYNDTYHGGGSVRNQFVYAADQWGWTQIGDE